MLDKVLLKELEDYIAECLIESSYMLYQPKEYDFAVDESEYQELENYIEEHHRESFAELLYRFIDEKELQDVEIYKKAGIDRRHFSKIRSNPTYQVSKQTGIAFAFALQLNKKETEQLLQAAGFSLSDYDTFDLIIQFFLEKEIYDVDRLNQALDHYSLKPLIRA